MIYQSTNNIIQHDEDLDEVEEKCAPFGAPVSGGLPLSLVVTQRAAAMLRAYLNEHELAGYRIFRCFDEGPFDSESHLDALGETDAAWEPRPPLIEGGETIATLTHDEKGGHAWESGVLRLPRHEIVLARWFWVVTEDGYGCARSLCLIAARNVEDVTRLRDDVARIRRGAHSAQWQIVRGYVSSDGPRLPRGSAGDETLLLSETIRRRVEVDLIQFFSPQVGELYRSMSVPCRRGVLLHGPPGNGKTSLIRHVGARLPDVPAMILRPAADFDSDDLEEVIRRWGAAAPAILVIEDLNWLLTKVNVSTFLNLLDGVDRSIGKGALLLIATTNHPDQLDPAVNNRPGRFDVMLEIPPPDRALRAEFLRRGLGDAVDAETIESVATRTDGLSFAHLQEVLRLSGLNAIHAGRTVRTAQDLIDAAATVRDAYDEAIRGFPTKPELPFGLLPLRDRNSNRART
jgi:hypothetical protein